MPHEPARVLQLDLFLGDAQAYRDALARYEAIRPILKRERTLAQHSRITGLSYWRLWRDLRRFRPAGILGLIDRRTLPHLVAGRPLIHILPRISSNTSCGWPWPIPSPRANWRGLSGSVITSRLIIAASSGCSPGIGSLRPRCSAITTWRSRPPSRPIRGHGDVSALPSCPRMIRPCLKAPTWTFSLDRQRRHRNCGRNWPNGSRRVTKPGP
jgi:hypothetical protein